MDLVAREYYEMKFKVFFMERKGNAFQEFFSDIMEKCHPGEFQRVRPWGPHGDRKNDGCIITTGQFFQVYAPNEMKANAAIRKIEEDFRGAIEYWAQSLREWIFVHNSINGLSPHIVQKLDDLSLEFPKIKISTFGFEDLRQKVFSLSEPDIVSLFGISPTLKDMRSLGFDDLKPVLLRIGEVPEGGGGDIRPVPLSKLQANGLSSSVQTLIKAGMTRAHLVEDFFKKWHDPLLGDRVASAFGTEYNKLRCSGHDPDEIFYRLQIFAGGELINTPKQQTAVLAVLAHLFESCDIYERPREEITP